MTIMPANEVGKNEEASLSTDSGFRSDSREGHFATTSSPSTLNNTQCSLYYDRTRSVSQYPTYLYLFCPLCLEQLCQSPLHSSRPKCQSNVQLSKIGLSSEVSAAKEPVPMGSLDLLCAQCKTGSVVANCVQCIQLLCKNCSASHDSNHIVIKLDAIGSGEGVLAQKDDEADSLGSSVPRKPFRLLDFSLSLRDIFQNKNSNRPNLCQEHGSEVARYNGQNCKKPIGGLCCIERSCLGHEYVMLNDVLKEQNGSMSFAIEQSKATTNDLLSSVNHLECLSCQLKNQFEESLSNESGQFTDANNSRIQVFNRNGNFKCIVGQERNGDGDLVYPNRSAVNMESGVINQFYAKKRVNFLNGVADKHNDFNVTIFRQDGQLVRAMGSGVKDTQCFDIALMSSTFIVMSSKDVCV